MGALNSCLKSKNLHREGNEHFTVGTGSMQGLRFNQEDAHLVMFSLPNHPNVSFFGVFDGHGGEQTSLFLSKNIIEAIDKNKDLNNENIIKTLLELDKRFTKDENFSIREQGSTCVFGLVTTTTNTSGETEYNVACYNIGDSRCLKISPDGTWEPLSNDHKPMDKNELLRIKEAGGYVVSNRVDGTLAVSRAFGDYNLKNNPALDQTKQRVTAEADVIRSTLSKNDLLLVCCDGIFENLDNSQVAQILVDDFYHHKDPAKTISKLFDHAEKSGSSDNMTGVLVHLEDGRKKLSGTQFVPGPIFRSLDDKTFLDAYINDAKRNGYEMTPAVMLTAYHQDLMAVIQQNNNESSAVKDDILSSIAKLKPWEMKMEDFAFLINALSSEIVIAPKELEAIEAKGVKDLMALRQKADEDKLGEIGLSEDIAKNVHIIFTLWRQLPGAE